MVLLGEQTHGDGITFLAKTRLSELQRHVASAAAPDRSGHRAFWAQLLTSLRQEALKLRAQLDSHDSTATREERESAFRRQWRPATKTGR